MSWRRILLFVVVIAVVAGGLGYAFWPQPLPVDLGEITRGPLRVTIDEEGETRVKDVYVVSAPLAGEVLRIGSEVGDVVKAGKTLLATIQEADPVFLNRRTAAQAETEVAAAQAALTLAEAQLARAKSELAFSRADLERARTLIEHKTISRRALDFAQLDVDTREAAVKTAEANVEVRRSELETARAGLIMPESPHGRHEDERCCIELRSPINGRVLRVLHESQGVVAAGTPLVELGDPTRLEVVVDLLSTDAVKVQEGAAVDIVDWGRDQVLSGYVRRVEPYAFTKVSALGIEEQRVNVIIDFADPPEAWRPLGHGYRVEARIIVWRAADVLRVPTGALFRVGDDWAVFVEKDGRAEQRIITIGHSNDREAEVTDGLSAGEHVVLHPSDQVVDGTRIVARAVE